MQQAHFSFDSYLRYFLRRQQKQQPTFAHTFDRRASVKDMIESLGVPHAEVAAIHINDAAVDFSYIVKNGDCISVYGPEYDAIALPLRPPFAGRPRFVLDTHLGRLAAYLRMMGFDSLYRNDYPDDELAEISHHENRILLTRDIGLLKRSLVIYGYYVRSLKPRQRLVEVVQRFDLTGEVIPFKHCMKCNGLLHTVDKMAVIDQIPDGTARYYDEFHQCAACLQIFWKGAHYQRMQNLIDGVMNGGKA